MKHTAQVTGKLFPILTLIVLMFIKCGKDEGSDSIQVDTVFITETEIVYVDLISINEILLQVDENPKNGMLLCKVAYDEFSESTTLSLRDESQTGAFTINQSGELMVSDSSLFDYELHSELSVKIVLSEDTEDLHEVLVKVAINDLEFGALTVEHESYEIETIENPESGIDLLTIEASSTEGVVNYSLLNDPDGFSINESGVISIDNYAYPLFDFETDGVNGYQLEVEVSHGEIMETVNIQVNLRDTTILWTGDDITFTKTDNADWTLPENQDCLSENVCITRQNKRGIFNIVAESEASGSPCDVSTHVEPTGTLWGFGTLDNIESVNFKNFQELRNCGTIAFLNQDLVLHLVPDDVYLNIEITSWTAVSGGGFSYTRSTPSTEN